MRDPLLSEAIEFARYAHAGQTRKGTRIPYLVHPLRVGRLLGHAGAEREVVVAGVLHDTIEDTPVTARQIAALFGDRIAAIVVSVSEPDKGAPWAARKRHTIEMLGHAPEETLLVACADKLDNVRSMLRGERRVGPDFWSRFHRPKPDQAWYYRQVSGAIVLRAGSAPLRGLAGTLVETVDELFGERT